MSDLPPFDPYLVLGVDKTADSVSIRKAYRKLALVKHPDKCTDEALKDLRTDEFQRLNEAYDILGDDEKRKRHDALVKLEALRKAKFSMAGAPPRPFTRAATFQNAYPSSTAYTSRGATNVEDRAPKGFYEDDDRYSRRQQADYDYPRRSAGGTTRAERERERARAEREEERRRSERRRDEQVREARQQKYEETDRYPERESRREEPSREKYDSWEESLKAYTNKASEPRPGMSRRTATTEVPRNGYATRSRAAPKERRGSQEERDVAEQLRKENERLERLKRQDEERERERRDREAARQRRYEEDQRAEKAERLARLREREERDRKREQEESDRRERETRPRRKENVEPFERRPPVLQHNHSSPPILPQGMLPRARTEPISPEPVPYPSMSRSSTMPSVPASNTAARRTTVPSKLRESHQPDSGYSSNSTNNSEPRGSRSTAKPAKPVKVTNYHYGTDGTPRTYAVETHEPHRSPTDERASSKMANLAKHAARPGPSTGYGGAASYSLPTRTRSPERASRREREYSSRGATRPLYGERTPSFDPDSVSWSKPITPDDVTYSRSGRRAEKDAYGYSSSHQRFDRQGSMPIPPMP